jgi:hypothetical protein
MATEKPSKEYPFVYVGEDHAAFRSKRAAVRDIKRRWAAQDEAERNAYYIARVETFVEPEYDFDATATKVDNGELDPDMAPPGSKKPAGAE